jgi:ATP-dependent protease HslVU (ClpYQ) peptidase subunit
MMAGDKQFTYRQTTKMKGKTKIYEVPTPAAKSMFNAGKAFIGFAGDTNQIGRVLGWLYDTNNKPPKLGAIDMLVLTDKKQIFHATTLRNWLEIHEPFFAIGSGMNFALAAMAAGSSPYEAVKIASKYDPWTGMGFNKLEM